MAVGVSSRNSNNASASSVSVSITVAAGDRLYAFLSWQGEDAITPSSVVFNTSEAFTNLDDIGIDSDFGTDAHHIHVFRLAAPTATTANVVATMSGSTGFLAMTVYAISGADSERGTETVAGSGTMTDAVPTVAGDLVISGVQLYSEIGDKVAAGDTTNVLNEDDTEFYQATGYFTANDTSATMGFSDNDGEAWCMVSVAIIPAAEGGGTAVPVFYHNHAEKWRKR